MKSPGELMIDELARLCRQYQLDVYLKPRFDEILKLSRLHFELLLKWNRKISLTSIVDPREAARLHYFEALFASQFIEHDITSAADLGSGGGFPGLPIALARPEVKVSLVEADKRKCAFLSETRRTLGLDNLTVVNARLETISVGFQLITVRALEKFSDHYPSIFQLAAQSRLLMLFLSLDDANSLINSAAKESKLDKLQPQQTFKSEVNLIPESKNRAILLLRQNS